MCFFNTEMIARSVAKLFEIAGAVPTGDVKVFFLFVRLVQFGRVLPREFNRWTTAGSDL